MASAFYFDGTSNLVIGGKLGIGTTQVANKLAVQGGMTVGTYSGTAAPANSLIVSGNIGIGTTLTGATFHLQHNNTNNILRVDNIQDGSVPFIISANGNVGIGTDNPVAKFHVEGNISSPALTGQVAYFARTSAPTGWLKCNGTAWSRTTYKNLFDVIGTTFGIGDNSTTFNMPDLRAEFIRGLDDGRGVDTGRSIGSFQSFAMQNITGSAVNSTGNRSIFSSVSGAFGLTSFVTTGWQGDSGANGYRGFDFDASRQVQTAQETRPRNIALLACIKY